MQNTMRVFLITLTVDPGLSDDPDWALGFDSRFSGEVLAGEGVEVQINLFDVERRKWAKGA